MTKTRVVARRGSALLAAVFWLLPQPATPQAPLPEGLVVPTDAAAPRYVPGEVLVKFKDAADAEELASTGRLSRARRPALSALLQRFDVAAESRPFRLTRFRRLDRVVKLVSRRAETDPARLSELLAAL